MYEVILSSTDIKNNFICKLYHGKNNQEKTFILVSTNKDIDFYINYIRFYQDVSGPIGARYLKTTDNYDYDEYSDITVFNGESLTFCFPIDEEETAFYFKLKYQTIIVDENML